MSISSWIKRRPLVAFFVLAFLWSWLCWSVLVATTPPGGMQKGISGPFLLLAILGGFGPSVAAFAVTHITEGIVGTRALLARLGQWRSSVDWYLISLFTVPLASIAALCLAAALGNPLQLGNIRQQLPLAIIWGAFASLGEEFGWRGFALPRLQQRYSALFSALVIGAMWGVWHLPPDYIGLRHFGPLFLRNFVVVGPVLLAAHSVIMTWIHTNTRQSLLFIVLYHLSITASSVLLSPLKLTPHQTLRHSMVSAGVFWLLALLLLLRWGAATLAEDRPS